MYAIQEIDTRKRFQSITKSIDKLKKKIYEQEAHIAKMMISERQLRPATLNMAKATLEKLQMELINITDKMTQLVSFARAHDFTLTDLQDNVAHIERRISKSEVDIDDLMNSLNQQLTLGGNKRKHLNKKRSIKKKSSKKRRTSSKNKKRVTRK